MRSINLLSEHMNSGKNSFEVLNYKRSDKMILSIIENNSGYIKILFKSKKDKDRIIDMIKTLKSK